MKIDWKSLAKSEGYRSLKAACNRDVMEAAQHPRPMRKKAEFHKLFRWVIARATHYAHRKGITVAEVLNAWESDRDYWWLNYYQESKQPKLPSGKRRNVRPGTELHYLRNNNGFYGGKSFLQRVRRMRQVNAINARKRLNKSARWGAARKKREAEMRGYRQQSL